MILQQRPRASNKVTYLEPQRRPDMVGTTSTMEVTMAACVELAAGVMYTDERDSVASVAVGYVSTQTVRGRSACECSVLVRDSIVLP